MNCGFWKELDNNLDIFEYCYFGNFKCTCAGDIKFCQISKEELFRYIKIQKGTIENLKYDILELNKETDYLSEIEEDYNE